jgi:hypothetical protein
VRKIQDDGYPVTETTRHEPPLGRGRQTGEEVLEKDRTDTWNGEQREGKGFLFGTLKPGQTIGRI